MINMCCATEKACRSIHVQANLLKKYYNKAMKSKGKTRAKYEKLFFDAYPDSFVNALQIYAPGSYYMSQSGILFQEELEMKKAYEDAKIELYKKEQCMGFWRYVQQKGLSYKDREIIKQDLDEEKDLYQYIRRKSISWEVQQMIREALDDEKQKDILDASEAGRKKNLKEKLKLEKNYEESELKDVCLKHSLFFYNLKNIPKDKYYNKCIDHCIGGWETEHPFCVGAEIVYGLRNDTEACASILSKRSFKEIISVFMAIFDAPHPPKGPIQASYDKELYEKVYAINPDLARSIEIAYNKIRHGAGGCCVGEGE